MTLPDYQSVTLPLLKLATTVAELRLSDAFDLMSQHFHLTEADLAEMTASGKTKMHSRVHWAATYLAQARLVSRPKPGWIAITPRGVDLLATGPSRIDYSLLKQYPEFVEFLQGSKSTGKKPSDVSAEAPEGPTTSLTPDELIDQGYRALRAEVETTLLDKIRSASPAFFEQTVVDLLVAMGYGGSHENAARRIGKTGDEGIDGVIDEDRLGLDAIYIQAKRWKADHTVGSPDVQGFIGSLVGKKAAKGVFITTSTFSQAAMRYLDSVAHRVVTIDGREVARLMFTHGVGVRTTQRYDVKAVDQSYFDNDQ
jgi:restriction system protein